MQASFTRGIDHVGLTVPDLDEATHFLQQAFGAIVLFNLGYTHLDKNIAEEMRQAFGLPEGTQGPNIRMLKLANGPSVELFHFAPVVPQQKPAGMVDFGYTHLGIYVEDVAAAGKRFEEAGGRLLSKPLPMSGEKKDSGNDFVYGRTPWGALVELVRYPAGNIYPETGLQRWTPAE